MASKAIDNMPSWYPDGKNPHGEPFTKDGGHNVLYWAWELQRCHSYQTECLQKGIDWRSQDRVKAITANMDKAGLKDLTEMGSNRTEALIFDHPDELFEQTEETLLVIKQQLEKIYDGSRAWAMELLHQGHALDDEQKKRIRRSISLIDEIIWVQRFCKSEWPSARTVRAVLPHKPDRPDWVERCMRWTWPLRVQVYAKRADVPGWHPVMDIAQHHIDMAVQVGFSFWGGSKGCLVEIPPRHGKTEFGYAQVCCWLADNTEQNIAIFHHKKKPDASTRLMAIRTMVSPDNPTGRRMLAMFPQIRVVKNRCTTDRIFVERASASAEPSVAAYGINEGGQGRTFHKAWFDDIVDDKERFEETQRNKTYMKLTATWLPRLTGSRTFYLITCTPWHTDDAYARLRKAEGVVTGDNVTANCHVVQLPVGDQSANDPTAPLWDKYGRTFLRQKMEQLGKEMYACLYQLNPRPQASRIVKKIMVVEHNPETDEGRRFVAQSHWILSVDPAGTSPEKALSRKVDKAGVVYAAINRFIPQIRIVDAWEIGCDQIELSHFLADLASSMPVHEILVETHGGQHATADYLESEYGLNVTKVTTQNRNKGMRLRAAAAYFQNGKISFAGQHDEAFGGRTVLKPELKFVREQILDFGSVPQDHALDAVTQIFSQFAADVYTGEADVSDDVRRQAEKVRQRSTRLYRHVMAGRERRRADAERDQLEDDLGLVSELTCGGF